MTIYSLQKAAREARQRLIEQGESLEYELGNALAAVDVLTVLFDRQLSKADRADGHGLVVLNDWTLRAAQASLLATQSTAHRGGRWLRRHDSLSAAVGQMVVDPTKPLYVLLSDADWQAGDAWAAVQLAASWKLNALTFITVMTGLRQGCRVDRSIGVEPLRTKLSAFQLAVYECDGHHYRTLIDGLYGARHDTRPSGLLVAAEFGSGLAELEEAGAALLADDRVTLLHQLMSRL